MPVWLREKLFLKQVLRRELGERFAEKPSRLPRLLFAQHHQSHAASAFYSSPCTNAAVLCVDGVGEWASTSAWHGTCQQLDPLWQISFPHSLGLFYSAFTGFCGFRVNSGEYKLMGLAPYGQARYTGQIRDHLIDIRKDGTFRLNLDYFDFCTGSTMTSERFSRLFETVPRQPDDPLRPIDMDLAASVQKVTEEILLRLSATLQRDTGSENLCLAGGVALNCVAAGKVRREGSFRHVWVQPAAGDAGGAVGAALAAWHQHLQNPKSCTERDGMSGCLLGTEYTDAEIERCLSDLGMVYDRVPDELLFPEAARLLSEGAVVGWFQDRMEFGPRALGARSILADPRLPDMQDRLNHRIKGRESFRPFAPAVLMEEAGDYFETSTDSPYMSFTEYVRVGRRYHPADQGEGLDRVHDVRSDIPAVTHVDWSARLQTVTADRHPAFHRLLTAFRNLTGCSVLINTSFNVRGEPIVESPEDACRCFLRTGMDVLILGNHILYRHRQSNHNLPERAGKEPARPDRRTLKHFSRSVSVTVVLLFGIGLPWVFATGFPLWPWLAGMLLALWGETLPDSLAPVHAFWLRSGHLLSRITTPVLLGIVYFVILTPTGCIKRWVGQSRFRRYLDPLRESYREPVNIHSSMEDPF